MWECLYLKVIPICHRNILTEHFSKLFPIVLVDDWKDRKELGMDIQYLEQNYERLSNWKNYYLLDQDLSLEECANIFDKKIEGPLGIIGDDIIAGIYSLMIIFIIKYNLL